MDRKQTKRKRKSVSKKKISRPQFRPFGKFADPLSSETSDSDYIPDGSDCEAEEKKIKLAKKIDNFDKTVAGTGKDARYDSFVENKVFEKGNKPDGDFVARRCQYDDTHSVQQLSQAKKLFWNRAPTEILVKVFKYFVAEEAGISTIIRCGRVCSQWNYCSKHPSLWTKVDLSFMSNTSKANDSCIRKLVKLHGDNISHLFLNNWKKITSKGLLAISSECPNLETLSLSGCSENTRKDKGISAESVMAIIDKCNLQVVDLSWLKLSNFSKVILALTDKCGCNLLSLNLCGCPVRAAMLNSIMDGCPNLQILDISNTLIFDINMIKLQSSFPNLVELYIAKSNVFMKSHGTKKATDEPSFKNMKALSIQSELLTDKLLACTTRGAKNLKLLDLRSCRLLTSKALMEIEAHSIERLFLSHSCASFSLRDILEKWGDSLEELDLSWISAGSKFDGLDDNMLGSIAKTGMKYCKMVKMDLSGTTVNDLGVWYILAIFPGLQSLNLTSCKGLSRGIKHLHERKSIEQLCKMDLAARKVCIN
ncbi:F-box/LRR-repeat protein 6-like [Rhopilema esculentum]|uniref:F-box/LRR-repeat protein 6-like n=1 Tax=Rhopilema esculentum TaxID=499914 RepID=UPI0031E32A3C